MINYNVFININLRNKKFLYFCIFLSLNVLILFFYYDNTITSPFIGAYRSSSLYKEIEMLRKNNLNIIDGITINESDKNSGLYVIVIGESQNKNHMSAYGYQRITTPWLDSIKNNFNTILFTNAYSCHTLTHLVLQMALTAKNQYNNIDFKYAPTLIDIANYSGFNTIWISNQVRYGGMDITNTLIASQCHQQKWINSEIGWKVLSDHFDFDIVDEIKKCNITDKTLMIIHLMGNHASYIYRYPKYFKKFTGLSNIDYYDNSIFYNDFVMKSITNQLLKIKNFKCMFYFSDHSENMIFAHNPNNFSQDMIQIPMYCIASEEYSKSDIFKNLIKCSDKIFTNDLIYDFILNILGIKTKHMLDINNIFSEAYDNNKYRFKTLYGKKNIF